MQSKPSFDTSKKIKRPYPILLFVEWIITLYYTIVGKGARVTKHNCEGLKPPYLLLSNHASMIDFPMALRGTFPHAPRWVISVEEFIGREWLLRGVGGIYKRKFTADIKVVRHILDVLKRQKGICVMYPEGRFSLAGINERMSGGIGKLVKVAGCPVVVMIEHGHFICQPQWDKKHQRHNPVCADMTMIISKEEAASLSAEELQKKIEDAFVYDDYLWQAENRIRVRSKYRANNLHKILYQCPICGKEHHMDSRGTTLFCNSCGAKWEMDEYGKLHRVNGEDRFTHVPDWYRWERENVYAQVYAGEFAFRDQVRLEHLVSSSAGFRAIGTVSFSLDQNGFLLDGTLNSGEPFHLERSCQSMESCHIEYDFYKKGVTEKGPSIDLTNGKETYFVFPQTRGNELTKIHFAAEALHDKAKNISRG